MTDWKEMKVFTYILGRAWLDHVSNLVRLAITSHCKHRPADLLINELVVPLSTSYQTTITNFYPPSDKTII